MPKSLRSYRQEAEQLRSAGRSYRQIAILWRERDGVNSRVAFRLAHGLTQADVAKRWNALWPDPQAPKTAKSISYWEIWPAAGGRTPSPDTLNKLAYLYRCSAGELLDGEDFSALDPANAIDVEIDRASHAASGIGLATRAGHSSQSALVPTEAIAVVTPQMIDNFELITDAYRRTDYRSGSPTVAAELSGHLRRMLELSNRTKTESADRHLMRAIGDAAQLSGWLAMDAQNYPLALDRCRLAVSIADKINDRALQAYSLGVISYIHLHAGDGGGALRVLGAARDIATRGVPSAVISWIYEAIGEAHGLCHEPGRGSSALAIAERRFDGVTADNTPAWLTFFNADCHAARLKGRCLMRLRQPEKAVSALHEALALLPPSFVRERSGTLIDLAHAHAQLGQVEEACHVAGQADQLARRTHSERNRNRLRQLLVDLMSRIHLSCVQDLYRQVLLN